MLDRKESPDGTLDPAQAMELAALVELEARWENLRASPPPTTASPGLQNLQAKQKAYDAFRARLAAYNKRYAPAYLPELLLNTPPRLGRWCVMMCELFSRIAPDPQPHSPVHLVEKAYRWADRVADKLGKARPDKPNPPDTTHAAIASLDALSRWCGGLVPMTPAA